MWETIGIVVAIAAALGFIILYRLHKLREESDPDVQKMKHILEQVENFVEKRGVRSELSGDTIRALNNAMKIIVLCKSKDREISSFMNEGDCAVMIFLRNSSYYPLYKTRKFEYSSRFARKLGKILGLPVEMI